MRYVCISKSTLRHTKARHTAAECLWALATMLLICNEGDRSCNTKTPKSRTDLTTGRTTPSMLRQVLQETLPIHCTCDRDRQLPLGGPTSADVAAQHAPR